MSQQPETLCKPSDAKKPLAACFEMTEVLASAVLAIAILFTFFMRFAGVVGSSMQPTLHHQDWLAITAHLPEPARGSIVIVSPRTNRLNEPLVKRIVAIAGDEVDIREGLVWINGRAIHEPYLIAGIETEPAPGYSGGIEFPATVPANMVFVLGDNRIGSTDSRNDAIGFVRQDDILGRVLFRMWPEPSGV